jgi:hypothetical protein
MIFFVCIAVNVKSPMVLENKFVEKEGERFIEVNNFKVKLDPDKIHIDLENLFNGNEQLGKLKCHFIIQIPLANCKYKWVCITKLNILR